MTRLEALETEAVRTTVGLSSVTLIMTDTAACFMDRLSLVVNVSVATPVGGLSITNSYFG